MICFCYKYFVISVKLNLFLYNNLILIATFKTYIFHYCDLDICDYCLKTYNFYHDCWNYVDIDKDFKFKISNKLPLLYYQLYPNSL